MNLADYIGDHPVIAALRDKKEIGLALASKASAVFLLGGSLFDLSDNVKTLQRAGKIVFVHLDLIGGLNKDHSAVHIVANHIQPNGILTTKNALIPTIQKLGMLAGQRCFLLDTQSYYMTVKSARSSKPDFVELMPGIIPDVIAQFCEDTSCPAIAGGFVSSVKNVERALAAGAIGASSSRTTLWNYTR